MLLNEIIDFRNDKNAAENWRKFCSKIQVTVSRLCIIACYTVSLSHGVEFSSRTNVKLLLILCGHSSKNWKFQLLDC